MADETRAQRQAVLTSLETKANILREVQTAAIAPLEEAFVFARLLEPQDDRPDTQIEELNLQKEYQDFRAKLYVSDGISAPSVALHTGEEHLYAYEPLTAEQEHEQELQDAFWRAQERLQSAQHAFDRRENDRAIELQARAEAVIAAKPLQTRRKRASTFDGSSVIRN